MPAVQLYQEDPAGNVEAVFDQNVGVLNDNSQRVTIPRTAVRFVPDTVHITITIASMSFPAALCILYFFCSGTRTRSGRALVGQPGH